MKDRKCLNILSSNYIMNLLNRAAMPKDLLRRELK